MERIKFTDFTKAITIHKQVSITSFNGINAQARNTLTINPQNLKPNDNLNNNLNNMVWNQCLSF